MLCFLPPIPSERNEFWEAPSPQPIRVVTVLVMLAVFCALAAPFGWAPSTRTRVSQAVVAHPPSSQPGGEHGRP